MDDEITNWDLTSVGTLETSTGALPNDQDGNILVLELINFNDLFLATKFLFGDDSEVTLTHNADKGLTLKHTSTSGTQLLLLVIQIVLKWCDWCNWFHSPRWRNWNWCNNLLGSIRVISEGDFSDTSNQKESFMLGVSEASEVVSVSSNGTLTISGNLVVSGTTTTVSSTTIEVNDHYYF